MLSTTNKLYWTILTIWFVHLAAFFYCVQDKSWALVGALIATFCVSAGLVFVEDHNDSGIMKN